MAKGIYMTTNGVLSKVPSIYGTFDGILKNVKEGYMTVDGVERQFYPGIWLSCSTNIYEVEGETYTGTYTINSWSSGLEDSGSYVMRINATFSKSTDIIRLQSRTIVYGPYKAGDTVTLKWTSGKDPDYTDKYVVYLDSTGSNIIDSTTLSSSKTSGTYTGTVPEGCAKISFLLSVGTKGTTDTYFSLNSLVIGDITYI